MIALQQLSQPISLNLYLKTLTPIYTGGIGQYGEQIHPSGILGNIRHFSCLLAAAIGDSGFETRVWGASEDENHHAKRVALYINTHGLKERELPDKITWQAVHTNIIAGFIILLKERSQYQKVIDYWQTYRQTVVSPTTDDNVQDE